LFCFLLWILVQFGESDLDYLQSVGTFSSERDFRKDSVLLRFDPLLARPVPVTESQLPPAPEQQPAEDSAHKLDFLDHSLKQEPTSANNSVESTASASAGSEDFLKTELVPVEDDMNMSVDINMKDISAELNHINSEDINIKQK